jgi:hypothetical protein
MVLVRWRLMSLMPMRSPLDADDQDALAAGALGGLDDEGGKVGQHRLDALDLVLGADGVQEFRHYQPHLLGHQLGLELVVHQRIVGAVVVATDVAHVAPIHAEHAQLRKLARPDPVHTRSMLEKRPSSMSR